MTNDERLEALAKAMFDVDYLGWNEETEDGQDDWRRWATAALRHLNCVNSKGEVFVPDVRAAVSELREAECACSRITIGHDIHAEPCSRCAALRALTGGSDEG